MARCTLNLRIAEQSPSGLSIALRATGGGEVPPFSLASAPPSPRRGCAAGCAIWELLNGRRAAFPLLQIIRRSDRRWPSPDVREARRCARFALVYRSCRFFMCRLKYNFLFADPERPRSVGRCRPTEVRGSCAKAGLLHDGHGRGI